MPDTSTTTPTVTDITVSHTAGGRFGVTATVTHPGKRGRPVSFMGSEYGGPVLMVTPDGTQEWVSEPGRFGKFGVDWVCRFYGVAAAAWSAAETDLFAAAYLWGAVESNREALLSDGAAADGDLVGSLAPETRDRLDGQARAFAAEHVADLAAWFAPDHAGYDLWMTRSGEGVGFWARSLGCDDDRVLSVRALTVRGVPGQSELFDAATARLSDAARALGEESPYVGDDGLIYVS